MNMKNKKYQGYKQLMCIVEEIMEYQEYPNWSFINNVLDCKEILGDYELWFWFGELRIVPKEKRFSGAKAGELETLNDWNTLFDDEGKMTIELIGNGDADKGDEQ